MNKLINVRFLLVFAFVITFSAVPAYAYIGPGLGVVAIWGILGPLAAAISLILMLAYFPARYYYKKWKHGKNAPDDKEANAKESTEENSKSSE